MALQDGTGDRLYPLENFNFILRVEGAFDLPCKSVHGFNREKEYEYIQEGGLNDYVHMKRKPISKPFTFTVERYVAVDTLPYDPLQEGTELILPVMLFVSRFPGRFETTRRVYTFTGCTVISKEYGELNAEHSGLLVEKAVIAYRELLTVTTFDDKDIGKWSIKEPDKQRKATKDYSKEFETDEKGMIRDKRVGLWEFDKTNPQGKGKRSAKTAHTQGVGLYSTQTDEKTKDEPEGKKSLARKWEFVQTVGTGKKSVQSALTKDNIRARKK